MAYLIKNFQFARVNELFDYEKAGYRQKMGGWDLKAHGRSFIIEKCKNYNNAKFLDVGGGPSILPQYLHDLYDADVSVIDDFGLGRSSDKNHFELVKDLKLDEINQNVSYHYGVLGDGKSFKKLGISSYDCVYSVSVLEHIPPLIMKNVFYEMDQLLKTNGIMIHTIDVPIPLGLGESVSEKLMENGHLIKKLGLPSMNKNSLRIFVNKSIWSLLIAETLFHKFKEKLSSSSSPYLATSKGWFKFITKVFDIKNKKFLKDDNLIKISLDPDILVEPSELIYKGRLPRNTKKPYVRIASLCVVLQKLK